MPVARNLFALAVVVGVAQGVRRRGEDGSVRCLSTKTFTQNVDASRLGLKKKCAALVLKAHQQTRRLNKPPRLRKKRKEKPKKVSIDAGNFTRFS